MASLVLNLDTRWICADRWKPRPPYSGVRTHTTHWMGGLVGQSPSFRSGEEKIPLPLPGIEPRFLGCPARNLMSTERAISAPVFFMLSHVYETMFLNVKQRAAAMSISILMYIAQYRCVSEWKKSEKALNVVRSAITSNILPSVDELYISVNRLLVWRPHVYIARRPTLRVQEKYIPSTALGVVTDSKYNKIFIVFA